MFTEKEILRRQRTDVILRRHMQRAQAYMEAKMLVREMINTDRPFMSVAFKPVHYYMHLLPGFNTHFIPAKYVGWRRTRAVDVYPDPYNAGFVRVEFNANHQAKRDS